jgi:hypothetical protein
MIHRTLAAHDGAVTDLAFVYRGAYLKSAAEGEVERVWRVDTGARICRLPPCQEIPRRCHGISNRVPAPWLLLIATCAHRLHGFLRVKTWLPTPANRSGPADQYMFDSRGFATTSSARSRHLCVFAEVRQRRACYALHAPARSYRERVIESADGWLSGRRVRPAARRHIEELRLAALALLGLRPSPRR